MAVVGGTAGPAEDTAGVKGMTGVKGTAGVEGTSVVPNYDK